MSKMKWMNDVINSEMTTQHISMFANAAVQSLCERSFNEIIIMLLLVPTLNYF